MSITEPLAATTPVSDELRCPLCDYDLRGLAEHRCPECGHAFDPEQLRQAKLDAPAWFFEHARRRRLRAFVATAGRTCRPLKFWTDVKPATRPVLRRLVLWTIAWLLIGVLAFSAAFGIAVHRQYTLWNALAAAANVRAPMPAGAFRTPNGAVVMTQNIGVGRFGRRVIQTTVTPGTTVSYSDIAPRLLEDALLIRPNLVVPFVLVGWPLLTVLAFQGFGITLRRAGIHRGHLWRCVLYAWPIVALPMVMLGAASCLWPVHQWEFRELPLPFASQIETALPNTTFMYLRVVHTTPFAALLLIVSIVLATVHVVACHLRYLKLPQAFVQALLVQVVAWLALVAGLYYLNEFASV